VLEHIFGELVSFPKLLANPNFSIEVLFVREEVRRYEANAAGDGAAGHPGASAPGCNRSGDP
jgi:hypothetical protein